MCFDVVAEDRNHSDSVRPREADQSHFSAVVREREVDVQDGREQRLEERRLLHGILDRSRLQARQLLRGRHALSITQADPACTRRAKARRMSKGSD